MNKKFKVSKKWLDACGMDKTAPAFKVINTLYDNKPDQLHAKPLYVVLDAGFKEWIVDIRRGRFAS
jgi:hypothetical protein